MEKEWVAKSLTIWGVIITTLTGLLPVINQLIAGKGWTIAPEWITGLDQGIKLAIEGIGITVGAILVLIDRLKTPGEIKKTLTLLPPK